MSTRCRIGVELPNGKIKSIYCHHDGYLSWVGKMLKEHYQDYQKVLKLVELGDISSLHETVEETYPDSYKGWRDEDCPAREDENEWEFWSKKGDCGEEYVYLFSRHTDYDGETYYKWSYIEIPYPQDLDEAIDNLTPERVQGVGGRKKAVHRGCFLVSPPPTLGTGVVARAIVLMAIPANLRASETEQKPNKKSQKKSKKVLTKKTMWCIMEA